ncbi:hypothetical protein V497_07232 [Pseudogymnoascus sp. VKM F-4516 (FW-969)]|nr:hypothetical protein V497_07232 [Pseudogymnoascus sp. VKM F-4516 (FW-969)]
METPSRPPAAVDGADNHSSDEPQKQAAEATESAPSGTSVPLDSSDGPDTSAKAHPNPDLPQTVPPSASSSSPPPKDATSAAAPYGTRSRNRAGVSRPNYAEDREMDMEFEIQPRVKEDDTRKAARSSDARPGELEPAASGPASRKTAGAVPDQNSTAQQISKDHIPGTSTFSANIPAANPAQPSKKRKATTNPASSTPNGNHSTGNASAVTATGKGLISQNSQAYKETFMLSFDNYGARLQSGKLIADDGTVLGINDHVYLVCEPPGEPYYLGRIMEFLHISNDSTKPVDAVRMNWYYRPKDIGRKVNDTRQVFASMHSDISPLTALRGLCQIKHKTEVDNMDEYRRTQNCFWYEKLFDRYIHRYYEVIPTRQVVNVPAKVKTVLDDRWKFILVESGRGKELTSAVKSCKRCNGFCASNNSVDCAVCHQTYHMNCVRPPLLKKPSRGFAWACGPCSRAQERKLEARNTPNVADAGDDDDEMMDDEDEDLLLQDNERNTGSSSPCGSVEEDAPIHPGTAEQIYQASLWPFRYLGVHCKVEDALDYDDRIYPRASSRLGPRHQANVPSWPGRPVQLVKPVEIRRKYNKGGSHKKDSKLSKETIIALEAEKLARETRPNWVMDEPHGYIHRGEDHDRGSSNCTAELLFRPKENEDTAKNSDNDALVDGYLKSSEEIAKQIGVRAYSVNFLDKALSILNSTNFDVEQALKELAKVEKKDLKEPDLTPTEVKKFEDGISKFGSELHSVKKHVKTVSAANIVRFYYIWKKTERGKQIWGNYAGRKGKKEAKKVEVNAGKLQDDVADDQDDSAFDNEKAKEKKRGFQCKFCSTHNSRQWKRAPGTPAGTTVAADPSNKVGGKDNNPQLMVALCLSCAVIWRRYAVQWEDTDDHGKKASQGGRSNKRKAEDPLREFHLSDLSWTANNTDTANTPSNGTPAPQAAALVAAQEVPRKKSKGNSERDQTDSAQQDSGVVPAQPKKRAPEKLPAPPPVPEIPKQKSLPCAICLQMEPVGQRLACKECRMTVHRNCYGVATETRGSAKWTCDMCSNDRNPQVSIQYKCMLCPIESTPQDFLEPPKPSHKKKNDKDREKDRVERELAIKAAEFYRKKQEEMNRPLIPREPLKRTANNNWVHVTCAVWTPEVKFGQGKALERSEGIPSIPSARYDEICKICKTNQGACVACLSCRAPVHVECSHQAGYVLGFDISPVKGSRRDHVNIVNINGESGAMTAAVWCKDHCPTKTIVHRMHDIVDESGLNALQLYVQHFKQADLALTGTVRKATLVNQSTKISAVPISSSAVSNRRSSTTVISNHGRGSVSHIKPEETHITSTEALKAPTYLQSPAKVCDTCGVDVSPKWWPYPALPNTQPGQLKQQLHEHRATSNHMDDISKDLGNTILGDISRQSNPKQQVALAAAALCEGSPNSIPELFQCHKCHWNKVQKAPASPAVPTPKIENDTPQTRPPPSVPVSASSTLASPLAPPTHMHSASRYSWGGHPTFPPATGYGDWSRASPASQNSNIALRQYSNGSHSPRGPPTSQHIPSQPQTRQPGPMIPRSPHVNGALPSVSNSSYPSSPHKPASGIHPMQHGVYAPYAPSHPQHLTNGGPPPRALEVSFPHGGHSSYRPGPAFGGPHASPQAHRDGSQISREAINHNGNNAPSRRVNGGASASPSLQNLLS